MWEELRNLHYIENFYAMNKIPQIYRIVVIRTLLYWFKYVINHILLKSKKSIFFFFCKKRNILIHEWWKIFYKNGFLEIQDKSEKDNHLEKKNQIEKYLKIPIQRTHHCKLIILYQILSEILRVIQISVGKCILW